MSRALSQKQAVADSEPWQITPSDVITPVESARGSAKQVPYTLGSSAGASAGRMRSMYQTEGVVLSSPIKTGVSGSGCFFHGFVGSVSSELQSEGTGTRALQAS